MSLFLLVSHRGLEPRLARSSSVCLCHWASTTWRWVEGSNSRPLGLPGFLIQLPATLAVPTIGDPEETRTPTICLRGRRATRLHYGAMVGVAGFEPTITAYQAVAFTGLGYTPSNYAPHPGFEPGPPGSEPSGTTSCHTVGKVPLALGASGRITQDRGSVRQTPSFAQSCA